MPGALSTTLGRLTDAPQATALTAAERAELMRWQGRVWSRLERQAGTLARRNPDVWYEILAFERWAEAVDTRGLSPTVLALFYRLKRLIPRRAQLALRRALIRRQGLPRFPRWPFEPTGHDLLGLAIADALLQRNVDAVCFPWFWPDGARAAVTLTHDVESERGLANAAVVAGWEERHGFRSSFNVVSDWYPVDPVLLDELRARGHEIGSHAVHHDRSLFSSRLEFERQLPLLRESAERLGAVGFRSPATHRVVDWLSELPFEYDCKMPHSDPYEPIPGGTATVWPFFHGEVVELPYTAPQDHTLFNLLGHRDCAVWAQQLADVVRCAGLFQLLTHPDPDYLGRPATGSAYRDILATIAAGSGIATWSGDGVALEPTTESRKARH